jgi:putative hydrolase of the HAD superfamily
MSALTTIGFDADDTLWHHERFYHLTQQRFAEILRPYAEDTLKALDGAYRLVLITKGELLDQERKLAASGLGDYFDAVEIVSDKTPAVYARLFDRHGSGAGQAMMVGNSLASDVVPALTAGAHAVHVPSDYNWELDAHAEPITDTRFHRVPDLGALRPLLAKLG